MMCSFMRLIWLIGFNAFIVNAGCAHAPLAVAADGCGGTVLISMYVAAPLYDSG
jgi:hypothetical protein